MKSRGLTGLVGSCCVSAAMLWALPAAAQQFVVTEATYTATKDNTTDSHFFEPPGAGTPSNWVSPTDYAKGTAHVRLEVLSKPSDKKTLYNVCYEGTPTAACMGYSPPYTAPGVYEFSQALTDIWQYSAVDWSKGINRMALILKDENGTKVQGDPLFYPSTIHVTITVVAPGGTYVPPSADAGVPMDAGADARAGKDAAGEGGSAQGGDAGAADAVAEAEAADARAISDAGQALGADTGGSTNDTVPVGDPGRNRPPAEDASGQADSAASPSGIASDQEDGGCAIGHSPKPARGPTRPDLPLLGLGIALGFLRRRSRGLRRGSPEPLNVS